MRGRLLSAHFGCPLLGGPLSDARYDTIVALKLGYDPHVRRKCERLIWDPLDAFHPRPSCPPATFWQRSWQVLQFDDILATSPAAAESMADALPESVRVHLVPHHCDERLTPGRDPAGPIVYSGLGRYVDRLLPVIREACRRLDREFRWSRSQDVLTGAALALCLRCPPTNTRLNRICKPQIKIENAAAVGLPIVTTDCPAALTLHPELRDVSVSADFDACRLSQAMQTALARGPISQPYTGRDFLADMEAILEAA